MIMSTTQRQVIANQIEMFYKKHSLKETIDHFMANNEKKSTIYAICKRIRTNGNSIFKTKSGRPVSVTNRDHKTGDKKTTTKQVE